MQNSLEKLSNRALPRSFVLELTRSCNHACMYCYTAWGAQDLNYDAGNQKELTTEEVFTIVSRLQDECPVQTIALSGGEPLLRRDLPEILTFIRGRGIDSMIITNGMLLTPEKVEQTLVGGNYEVTLLSTNPEIHDRLAGCPGAWEAAIDGMVNIRRGGGNLAVAFIATKLNYQDLHHTVELAIALGAYALMYNRLNLGKYNLRFAPILFPSPEMVQENLDTLEEMADKYKLPISISVVCEPCVIDTQRYQHIHFGYCPLAGGDSYFTIDPRGNIRVCNHSPVILGNMLQESFTGIYYNHPYLQKFRQTMPEECNDCKPEWKEVCGGGCKAAAEQCFGNLDHVDPFVTISKGTEKNIPLN